MFYAIRTTAIAANVTERQLLSFYSKADRTSFISKNGVAKAVMASEARTYKAAGASHTVSDKSLNITFFSQIVL